MAVVSVGEHDQLHVLVVDDHAIVREGVAQLVARELPGCRVTSACSLDEADALLGVHRDCGLVILDLHLPRLAHPLEGLRRLRARNPLLAVLVLSGDEDTALALQALREGAAGFVPKSSRTAVLAGALQIVIAGDCYVPPSLMQVQGSAGDPLAALTPRQRDVLRQLIDGKANKEIARCLGMSEPTVKAHLVNIFRVLGVRNRAQAVLAGSRLLG